MPDSETRETKPKAGVALLRSTNRLEPGLPAQLLGIELDRALVEAEGLAVASLREPHAAEDSVGDG